MPSWPSHTSGSSNTSSRISQSSVKQATSLSVLPVSSAHEYAAIRSCSAKRSSAESVVMVSPFVLPQS
jgi:hypothetical protein